MIPRLSDAAYVAIIGTYRHLTSDEKRLMLRTFRQIRLLPETRDCPDIERDKWSV